MKKLIVCLLATNTLFFSAFAQNEMKQIEPVTPQGSGIFDFQGGPMPPMGAMGPKGMKGKKPPMMEVRKAPDLSYIKQKFMDVTYGSVSPTQTCDIYLPNDAKGPAPVIVDIHGGAFMLKKITSKDVNELEVVDAGVRHGYAVVSINYRLSGEARFPRAVNDAKAVIRFIRANAKKYNIDPNKVISWGGSAGGNLSALLGTSGNVQNLNGDNKENLQYSSAVQAVVEWFGPCDFRRFDEQFKAQGLTQFNSSIGDDSAESWYIGQNVFKDTTFTMKANPMTYIAGMNRKNFPPFLIEHGGKDTTVPIQQSINFYHALKAKFGSEK